MHPVAPFKILKTYVWVTNDMKISKKMKIFFFDKTQFF